MKTLLTQFGNDKWIKKLNGFGKGRNNRKRRDKMPNMELSEKAKSLKPGKYQHSKGNFYEVIGVARDSETLLEMVVYKALYGDGGLWVRPLDMFTENVEVNDMSLPRFRFVDE